MISSTSSSGIEFREIWDYIQDHVAEREKISFGRMGYNIGEKFALVHSEISEALEGVRKNLMDDHLPHRPAGEVECADAIIRMMGIAEHEGWDIPGAIIEKAVYNDTRADHRPENRSKEHGKRF
jgi:hypothetical protein